MNFQNIPRQDKTIKRAFLPKLEALCFFDYEQIEYRLLAYYLQAQLGETRMVDNFLSGLDPHTETAKLVLDEVGIEYDDPLSDLHRQVGKTANFSIVYAGGKPTIVRQLTRAGWNVDDALAARILAAVRSTMPEVQELEREIHARLDERGYIETVLGRQLRPNIKKYGKRDAYRRMLNALIQGGAAEIMREGLRETHKGLSLAGLQAHVVNVVHDELTVDTPKEELAELARLVPVCMDYQPVSEVVPVTTSMEISYTSWADKIPYEEV